MMTTVSPTGPRFFWGAGVHHAEPAHVEGARQQRGRQVRHQRRLEGGRIVVVFDAADRLVAGDVHVRCPGRELPARNRRRMREVLVLGRSGDVYAAELLRRGDRLGAPRSRVHVVRHGVLFGQVERHHGELQRGAALQEQDEVGVSDAEQLAEVRFGAFGDIDELGLRWLISITERPRPS